MNYKKHLFLLLLLSGTIKAQSQRLIIHKDDGTGQFNISDIRNITFNNSNMIVERDGGSTPGYPISTILKMSFGSGTITNVAPGKEKSILLFPNPASETINISWDGISTNGMVEIFNQQGKLVQSKAIDASDNIDISSLQEGMYILRINNGKEIITKTFVKN